MFSKRVMQGYAIALVLFLLFSLIVSFMMYGMKKQAGKKTGPAVSPAVMAGQLTVSKKVLIDDPELGTVTDLACGELDFMSGRELGIAGTRKYVLVNLPSSRKISRSFAAPAARVGIKDIDGYSVCEFLSRGDVSSATALFNHDGGVMWSYGSATGPRDVAAGDANGDGRTEFAVALQNEGIHLLDDRGNVLWKQSEPGVTRVEILDANGDGLSEIVHNDLAGRIVTRNGAGAETSRVQSPVSFASFSTLRWPAKGNLPCALVTDNGVVHVAGFNGSLIATFPAPVAGNERALGTIVRFDPLGNDYFALVLTAEDRGTSILNIYDMRSMPVYQETLPVRVTAVCAAQLKDNQPESLLLSANGTVWEYTAAQ